MPSKPINSMSEAETQSFPWGAIKWLMGQPIDPDAEQTFGTVYINAGERNPEHYHPNCEEILHVLSGTCDHTLGEEVYSMGPGDTVRVPAGVMHQAINTGWEPLRAIVSYSSGDRQTVFEGDTEA